ncbi:MAG TPA: hypothetical protein VGL75_14585 [Acidothermaceae bacterium]
MVPDNFDGFFTAAASAAGALIGLLFVAISMRPEAVLGANPSSRARALSSSSFTGLVNGFFVSMAALIPGKNLGVTASISAILALAATFRLQRQVGRGVTKVAVSTLMAAAFIAQLAVSIGLLVRPHSVSLVTGIAWITIASLAVALMRAWSLLQGEGLEKPIAASGVAPQSVEGGGSDGG